MRVLMPVVNDVTTDARVRREAGALAEAGHDVTVVAFDYGISSATTRSVDGVSYRLFPFPSRERSKTGRRLGAIVFLLRASLAILRTPADVVHSHNLHLAAPCLLAARRRRALLVYDAHELVSGMLRGVKRRLAMSFERIVWRAASAVVTTNQSRAEHLRCLYGGHHPVVLGNFPQPPTDPTPEDLRAAFGIPDERRILIYQGGFYVEGRNFDTVARALAQLPGWHWVLIGFGSERSLEQLRGYVSDAGIEDRVTISPAVPIERLVPLAAGADAGVVPLYRTELNNYLGDTNKLFEYLMAGIPAVGSDFPEVRRALLENPIGPVGHVFDPADVASIVRALEQTEKHLPELKERAARVGRECYSWELEKRKLQRLYEELASARDPALAGAPASEKGRP